jgi:hypothetical protein
MWTQMIYCGGGVLSHRTRYTYYIKYILNIFQNVKKNRQKILSVHLNNLCSPTKFYGEKAFLWHVKKIKKNGHLNNNIGAPKFVFSQRPQKMSFSHETSWMNIKCPDACQDIFFEIFKYFEICFLIMGASTPVSQSGFPVSLNVHSACLDIHNIVKISEFF